MSETVSACLIVRDEEERLPGALASVAWCDEIVVVDSGSRDRTREIARDAGAIVLENEWPGFAAQRNFALDHASSDWILEVDADERITPELASEIQTFLQDPPLGVRVCAVPRYDLFLGGRLGPSAKHPIYGYRFFRRGAERHEERRVVHEGIHHSGRVWAFEGEFEHIFAGNAREAWGDMIAYTRLEAEQLEGRYSAAAYLRGIVVRPAAKFLYRTVVDGGWRDGWRGLSFIALWCVYDSIVWTRHLLRNDKPADAAAPAEAKHFGRWSVQKGTVRIVAVARGEASTQRALEWLLRVRAAGADVALLTDSRPTSNDLPRVRQVAGMRPLQLLRELEKEYRVRSIDALVPMGGPERRLLRAVPAHLAPVRLDPETDPEEAARTVRAATRSDNTELVEVVS
jgi:hypothetical protein